jgi:hypothetical protein
MEIEGTEEIFETVDRLFPELLELLRQKHPELTTLYQQRYKYTQNVYPIVMRLHNAYQILRAYVTLKRQR